MITVLGSINLDLIANADRLPLPGETIPGNNFATASGGKGANQALAALRAGAQMRMEGAVGNDPFAAQALAELEKEGADLGGIDVLGDTTGIAVILVSGAGENVIVVIPGANGLVSAEKAELAVGRMRKGDVLLLQQEIPTQSVQKALDEARQQEVTTILNIAPVTDDTPALAALADIVVANETEFALLSGVTQQGDALAAQIGDYAKTHGQTLVVTLGGEGTLAATPTGEIIQASALTITPVDTVGAGDTFCGYLGASLDAGMPLTDALKRASIAGSLACLKPGAQPAIPNAKDVDRAR